MQERAAEEGVGGGVGAAFIHRKGGSQLWDQLRLGRCGGGRRVRERSGEGLQEVGGEAGAGDVAVADWGC